MAKAPSQMMQEPNDSMIEVALDEATHSQMMWFSKHQGYEYDLAETESQTYNRIKAAWDSPTIRVPSVIEEEVLIARNTDAPRVYTLEERGGLPETVDVIVQGDAEDVGSTVNLAHNGRAYLLQVGEKVTLPWYVFKGCIEDAKMMTYTAGRDTGLGPIRVSQSVSFTRVR